MEIHEAPGLRCELREGGVLLMTLDRPEILNPISVEVREAWNAQLQAIERDATDCAAVVVTGSGRYFCAGGDVAQMPDFLGSGSENAAAQMLRFQEMTRLVHRLPVPVIAAVNGPALGGGTAVALASDLRVASEEAVFSIGHVRRSVVPDLGVTYLLPRIVGLGKALELMLTDRRIDAAEALDIGLVNRVVPKERVLDEALAFAAELGQMPQPTLRWIKRVTYANLDASFDQALMAEAAAIGLMTGTAEFQAGIDAFLGKNGAGKAG
jgi:2-(1,2-epoxy-1,2-dihydrophenyl)acetyl-CoA isomerase